MQSSINNGHFTVGYIVFAYRTMEDMSTQAFAAAWQRWSGVQQMGRLLPPGTHIHRMLFYRQASEAACHLELIEYWVHASILSAIY